MTLLTINKGRGLTLPASIRKKYNLKPGRKLEIKDEDGEIVLTPLTNYQEDIFHVIDTTTKTVSEKEIAAVKKRVRFHAFLH